MRARYRPARRRGLRLTAGRPVRPGVDLQRADSSSAPIGCLRGSARGPAGRTQSGRVAHYRGPPGSDRRRRGRSAPDRCYAGNAPHSACPAAAIGRRNANDWSPSQRSVSAARRLSHPRSP